MALSSSSARTPRLSTATTQGKLQRLPACVPTCGVQSHRLGLGRHDTRRHGQNRFTRIDHARITDLNGGIAILFGEHQYAGLSAHGAEQSPALLGVLFQKESVRNGCIFAHIERNFPNPSVTGTHDQGLFIDHFGPRGQGVGRQAFKLVAVQGLLWAVVQGRFGCGGAACAHHHQRQSQGERRGEKRGFHALNGELKNEAWRRVFPCSGRWTQYRGFGSTPFMQTSNARAMHP